MTTRNFRSLQLLTAFVLALTLGLCLPVSVLAQDPAVGSSKQQTGTIMIIQVSGDAKVTTAEKPNGVPAIKGMNLRIGDTVVTGPGGRVSLAFSNGSLFEVTENTKFSVQEYLQEPWTFTVDGWNKLEKEPTRSQTKAFVEYGELVVKVKKLSEGSAMQVTTPLGVAGIRGTTFVVRVVRNPDGSPKSTSVKVAEGRVDFTPQGGGEPTSITPGNSVTVSVTVGPNGQIQISTPVQETLTPQEITLITEAVERMVEASTNINTLGDTSAQNQTGGEAQARPQPMPNTPSQPPPPPPTPTPTAPAPSPTPTPVPSGL